MRKRLNAYYMCSEFKIGTSVNGLRLLEHIGVPPPTKASYNPFSVRNVGGNKLVFGDGYPSCVWSWEPALTRDQISNLLSFITSGEASAYVYIRTTKNEYSAFYNFYCVMSIPVLEPVGHNVGAFNSVEVNFTAMVQQ